MKEILDTITTPNAIRLISMTVVALLGLYVLSKTFSHMKDGFGTNNIKIICILMVVIFSILLAIASPNAENSAIGILGAVVGYLFGYSQRDN